MFKFVIVGLFVASAMAVPTPEASSGNLDCLGLEDSFISCLVIKANTMLARAARSNNIDLIEGVAFVRETPMERTGKALKSETEVMNELPRETSERALKLGSMIYDSAVSFLKNYSLKVNIPEETIARTLSESRAKLAKKHFPPILIGLLVKSIALIPMIFGGLSLLVLKAVFIGKLALMIAGILAFQKMFANNGGVPSVSSIFGKNSAPAPAAFYDPSGAQSWPAPGIQQPGQQYYKRSFEDASKIAQNLAYSAHVPTESDH